MLPLFPTPDNSPWSPKTFWPIPHYPLVDPWFSHSHTREKRLKDYECVFIFNPVHPKVIISPILNPPFPHSQSPIYPLPIPHLPLVDPWFSRSHTHVRRDWRITNVFSFSAMFSLRPYIVPFQTPETRTSKRMSTLWILNELYTYECICLIQSHFDEVLRWALESKIISTFSQTSIMCICCQ